MNKLQTLAKIVSKKQRRLGRGGGSGRGKTSGRGTKGQKARGSIRTGFEGGQLPLIKRLPLYRGRGRNKSQTKGNLIVNLKHLNILPAQTEVTIETLVKHKVLRIEEAAHSWAKILGEGDLKVALIVRLPTSKSARVKIERAGGKVELPQAKTVSSKKH